MNTLTIKIPPSLDSALAQASARAQVTKSELVRRAVAAYLAAGSERNAGQPSALELAGDAGPAYTITSVDEDFSVDTFRRIQGEIEVPLFLDVPGPGGVMTVDENDVPQQNGTTTYPFTIMVPYSAQDTPAPAVA